MSTGYTIEIPNSEPSRELETEQTFKKG